MTEFAPSLLQSLHEAPSPLGTAFFSAQNLTEIQNALRSIINQKTGYIIGRQSDDDIIIIMRSIYALRANHERQPVQAEVQRLNSLVLAELVPMVGTGISQYLGYVRDASSIAPPLPRGKNVSIKGSKTAELFRGL